MKAVNVLALRALSSETLMPSTAAAALKVNCSCSVKKFSGLRFSLDRSRARNSFPANASFPGAWQHSRCRR
jgi:hypothetical protein